MSQKLNRASAIAVAATMTAAVIGAHGSGAIAQDWQPEPVAAAAARFVSEPIVQPLPDPAQSRDDAAGAADEAASPADADADMASSLAELVSDQPQPEALSRELNCLAGAIYFEAKGESLPGQLAVGRVVVARSKSGRFPGSYCGVVFQPSQFSFVRGNAFPAINRNSRHWQDAVAVAQIAHEGSWRSPVEGALFFHAARVSPGWRLKRIARVDNHIFYR